MQTKMCVIHVHSTYILLIWYGMNIKLSTRYWSYPMCSGSNCKLMIKRCKLSCNIHGYCNLEGFLLPRKTIIPAWIINCIHYNFCGKLFINPINFNGWSAVKWRNFGRWGNFALYTTFVLSNIFCLEEKGEVVNLKWNVICNVQFV